MNVDNDAVLWPQHCLILLTLLPSFFGWGSVAAARCEACSVEAVSLHCYASLPGSVSQHGFDDGAESLNCRFVVPWGRVSFVLLLLCFH
ncbi:hypothetical protein Nepgr_018762 [Nepenthes gracilis]|uniref:Secreted protein n=1 Tax=Nepenthes gracilis TaxID=150966 RepID=A0AAD3XUM7_NEPGR|nr:hypothetical protein Nepgr_018762 [Nepenthes gracilis]